MGAIADNKNAAQASECSFEQYTKDAVNCVTKKVRKYRKKLDKIAQTEKLDPEVLNKEQADMIRTKSVRFCFCRKSFSFPPTPLLPSQLDYQAACGAGSILDHAVPPAPPSRAILQHAPTTIDSSASVAQGVGSGAWKLQNKILVERC